MTRLFVVVEGQTEEKFVKDVLAAHLGERAVWATAIIVTTRRDRRTGQKFRGGGRWQQWLKDLQRLIGQQPGNDVRFTTLFDLYGLPDDFPELDVHQRDADTCRRAESLQRAMANVVGDWRLIPYIQRHEFEALVLASLEKLAELLDSADRSGLAELRADLRGIPPEDVDDGEETAPSKRLERYLPGYQKVAHGPGSIELAGLKGVRAQCPRFDSWIRALEDLSQKRG